MTEKNLTVSLRPSDVPVVLAKNLTYNIPPPLASGYRFSVVVVEEDEPDSGSGSVGEQS